MAEVDFDEPVPGSPALRAWAHRFASDIRAGVASHQRSTSVGPPTNVRGNSYSGAASGAPGGRAPWSHGSALVGVPAGVAPGQVRPGATPVEAEAGQVSRDLVRSTFRSPWCLARFVEAAQRGVACVAAFRGGGVSADP